MNNLFDVAFNSLIGLFGTIIGATITWIATNRASKTQTTFGLLQEFNSEDLLLSRHKVQTMRFLFEPDANMTLDNIFHRLTAEERYHVWQIIHFYQKLQIMIVNKQCNTKVVPELFGETFYWWYINLFADLLIPIPHRAASKRISELKTWFDQKSKSEDLAVWAERAKEARIVFVEENPVQDKQ